jgi:hypothetical protein
LNLLRGAGVDGLAPMVGDPTKPLLGLRKSELRDFVDVRGERYASDETNDDQTILRNRIRHDVLPTLSSVAQRDVTVLLARLAEVVAIDRDLLEEVTAHDRTRALEEVDCRELREWSPSRRARWLRYHLAYDDEGTTHVPTLDEVRRVESVIAGEAVATQISHHRRVARQHQFLRVLEVLPTTMAPYEH